MKISHVILGLVVSGMLSAVEPGFAGAPDDYLHPSGRLLKCNVEVEIAALGDVQNFMTRSAVGAKCVLQIQKTGRWTYASYLGAGRASALSGSRSVLLGSRRTGKFDQPVLQKVAKILADNDLHGLENYTPAPTQQGTSEVVYRVTVTNGRKRRVCLMQTFIGTGVPDESTAADAEDAAQRQLPTRFQRIGVDLFALIGVDLATETADIADSETE